MKTNNKVILNYAPGDRVSIRNTANPTIDFIINPATGTNVYLKTVLYKRPSNSPFNVNNGTTGFTQVFEWEISPTNPRVVDYRIQDGSIFPSYTFTPTKTNNR